MTKSSPADSVKAASVRMAQKITHLSTEARAEVAGIVRAASLRTQDQLETIIEELRVVTDEIRRLRR